MDLKQRPLFTTTYTSQTDYHFANQSSKASPRMWSGLGPEPQCVLLCGKCTALESQKYISELCGYLIHKNKNFCWQNHLDRYWDLKVHSFRCSMRFRIFTWARFKTPTIKITIVISLIFGFQWKNSSNWTAPDFKCKTESVWFWA